MMRHTLAEGWLLLRHRAAVSAALIVALAIPIALAGMTAAVFAWLQPVVELSQEASVVAVLLHPHMDDTQRQQWLEEQQLRHPDWTISSVPPAALAARLSRWFPYLADLFAESADPLLPPLVEVTAPDPEAVAVLLESPTVVAVGPRSSLHRAVGDAATRAGWILTALSVVLLAAACLLAAVWVHLELYRHGEEITVMRLVGATESTIRGPFVVAVAVPSVAAGLFAIALSAAGCRLLSRLMAVIGMPPIELSLLLAVAQLVLAVLLPVAVAVITLYRHALSSQLGEA